MHIPPFITTIICIVVGIVVSLELLNLLFKLMPGKVRYRLAASSSKKDKTTGRRGSYPQTVAGQSTGSQSPGSSLWCDDFVNECPDRQCEEPADCQAN